MFSLYDFLNLLSELTQMLGLLVFGIAAGWFTMFAFRKQPWQLQIAALLGFFLLAALISFSTPAAGVGAFGLGAGAAMLFVGLRNEPEAKEENEPKE